MFGWGPSDTLIVVMGIGAGVYIWRCHIKPWWRQ